MRLKRKQRGFLLNPYRFPGSTIGRDASMSGESTASFAGASIASAVLSADAEARLLGDSQTTTAASSMAGEATMTMVGASIAAGRALSTSEGSMTMNSASTGLVCDAADFDGSNDYLTRGAAELTPSKKGILSFWVRFDTLATADYIFLIRSTTAGSIQYRCVDARVDASGNYTFEVIGNQSTSFAVVCRLALSGAFTTGNWYHVLQAWDASAGSSAAMLYINDTVRAPTVTSNNQNAAYEEITRYVVGADMDLDELLDGGLAELYFAAGQYLDISVEENRRKFITSTGKPAHLGTSGETPTGSAPTVYLSLPEGASANDFAIQRASPEEGPGNFTVTGALSTYASSPSD